MVYDHNWDDTDYPISILDDTEAKQYVSGSAFHCYAGDSGNTIQVKTTKFIPKSGNGLKSLKWEWWFNGTCANSSGCIKVPGLVKF